MAPAAVPADPAARACLIGQPTALRVEPAAVTLTGPRALQQVVVTGQYADGTVRDLTPFCDLAIEAPDVAVVDGTAGLGLGGAQPRRHLGDDLVRWR